MIFKLLGAAFLGGLFLNVMPCLLPVLPLKIMYFMHQGQESRSRALLLASAYGVGIVTSFLILGGIIAGALMFGHHLGFGFQMESPWFNGFMAAILMGLALKTSHIGSTIWNWAVSHVSPGFKSRVEGLQMSLATKLGWVGDLVESAKAKSAIWGSFLHGCMTTLLGSACCGPFIGYAAGMALLWSPTVILACFGFMGLGMAAPYMILATIPGALKFLPKTGKWVRVIEIGSTILMGLTSLWFLHLAI